MSKCQGDRLVRSRYEIRVTSHTWILSLSLSLGSNNTQYICSDFVAIEERTE